MKYDYLVVGAGPFGSVFAYEANKRGKKVLIVEKRSHVGGNLFCESIEGINVHKYGAHIFHTSNEKVWDYVNQFAKFNRYTNSPIANFEGKLFNLPFNMNTFHQLWGVVSPQQAKERIERERGDNFKENLTNLEEQAINLVGNEIYQKLIKGYTEKQWGRSCKDLPAFIIRRLPVRFTFDNNYFTDTYQGIPIGGYNTLFEKWLENVEVDLNSDFFEKKEYYESIAKKVIFTGMIDQYFDYKFGALEYRSLRFENELMDVDNYQGNAVVNYTSSNVPYTRIIEHKHFEFGQQDKTYVTREYSTDWKVGEEPYYPINDEENNRKYDMYLKLANENPNVIFGGRLGDYKYYDMHNIIESALKLVDRELK